MTLAELYELTEAEFNLFDFRSRQDTPELWTITATRREARQSPSGKRIVGRGATEEAALRDLRLQWVVAQYGDYREGGGAGKLGAG